MTLVAWFAWAVTGGVALIDWFAVAKARHGLERWAKPGVMLGLLAVVLLAGSVGKEAVAWLLVALVLGMIGDIFLLGDTARRFKAGLASFLVGHMAYVMCFLALGVTMTGSRIWAGIAIMLVCLFASRRVLPNVHAAAGWGLSFPVAIYMGVIAVMEIVAWGTGSWLISLGAAVFVISDTVLSMDRFVAPIAHGRLIVMITYHVGQALIVAGVLDRTLV